MRIITPPFFAEREENGKREYPGKRWTWDIVGYVGVRVFQTKQGPRLVSFRRPYAYEWIMSAEDPLYQPYYRANLLLDCGFDTADIPQITAFYKKYVPHL